LTYYVFCSEDSSSSEEEDVALVPAHPSAIAHQIVPALLDIQLIIKEESDPERVRRAACLLKEALLSAPAAVPEIAASSGTDTSFEDADLHADPPAGHLDTQLSYGLGLGSPACEDVDSQTATTVPVAAASSAVQGSVLEAQDSHTQAAGAAVDSMTASCR